jgi:hypothetical protein
MLAKLQAGVELHLSPDEISHLARTGQELDRFGLGDERDPRIAPKISVFMDGQEVQSMTEPEPPESKKPN